MTDFIGFPSPEDKRCSRWDASGPPDVVSQVERVIGDEARTGEADGSTPKTARGWIQSNDTASHDDDGSGRHRDETEDTMIDVQLARESSIGSTDADVRC